MRLSEIHAGDALVVKATAPCLVEADDDPRHGGNTVLWRPIETAYYARVARSSRFDTPAPVRDTHDPDTGIYFDFIAVLVETVGVPYRKGRSGITVIGEHGERFTVHFSALATAAEAEDWEIAAEAEAAAWAFERDDMLRQRGWTQDESGYWQVPGKSSHGKRVQ